MGKKKMRKCENVLVGSSKDHGLPLKGHDVGAATVSGITGHDLASMAE